LNFVETAFSVKLHFLGYFRYLTTQQELIVYVWMKCFWWVFSYVNSDI